MSSSPKRQYFYYAKCLETNRVISLNPKTVCETASTIKVPILITLLKEVERGHISLRQPLKLKIEHRSHNGSGILGDFYRVRPLTIHDVALMMIVISDNIATNALIELLGRETINDYIEGLGLSKTRLIMYPLTFPDIWGINDERIGETTPFEMAELLEKALSGKLLNSTHTVLFRKFLALTRSSFFGRRLPSSYNTHGGIEITHFGNKTGACYYERENMQVFNDCGYFQTKDKLNYIFSVFSTGETDERMQYTVDSSPKVDFANVSKQIYTKLISSR